MNYERIWFSAKQEIKIDKVGPGANTRNKWGQEKPRKLSNVAGKYSILQTSPYFVFLPTSTYNCKYTYETIKILMK